MRNIFKETLSGFWSLLVGMRITITQFFKPIVTVQYPHATLKLSPRFRGHIELVLNPATGKAKCFACKLCERACPSDCITVEGAKLEGAKKKSVTAYRLDFTKCSLCGSCVEACRDGAIRFSRDYNLAGVNKEDFVMDLFKRLEAEAATAEVQSPKSVVSSPLSVASAAPPVAVGEGTGPTAPADASPITHHASRITPASPLPPTPNTRPSPLDPSPSAK